MSTKELGVDSKEWNMGASKVHKFDLFPQTPPLPDWPIRKTSLLQYETGGEYTGLLGSDWEIQVLNSQFTTNVALWGLSIIFIFLPLFIQFPFPLLASLLFYNNSDI